MILSDLQILQAIVDEEIVIRPFDPKKCLGPNSYDVHLGDTLMIYEDVVLDCKKRPTPLEFKIPDKGFVLSPGTLYLGSIIEYTETRKHVPFLEGRSSLGRLGLSVHVTAGVGDNGFSGYFTLEMTVVTPLRVYGGMPIGQLLYFKTGEVGVAYDKKSGSKYADQGAGPQPSKMYLNFK